MVCQRRICPGRWVVRVRWVWCGGKEPCKGWGLPGWGSGRQVLRIWKGRWGGVEGVGGKCGSRWEAGGGQAGRGALNQTAMCMPGGRVEGSQAGRKCLPRLPQTHHTVTAPAYASGQGKAVKVLKVRALHRKQ